jgi:Xaa-Pro aminopeptidase
MKNEIPSLHYPITNGRFIDVTDQDFFFSRDFAPAEFHERRKRVAAAIGPEAHALVCGTGFQLAHEKAFYYLCGLTVPRCHLLISGVDATTTLFIPERGEFRFTTPRHTIKDAVGVEDAEMLKARLGVDRVMPSDSLAAELAQVRTVFIADKTPHEPIPVQDIRDLTPTLSQMRLIKSPAEIEVMRQAAYLSARAIIECMKATRPGVTETKLHAIIDYIYRAEGGTAAGYGTIAANGYNTWNGHYNRNNCTLVDGNYVLVDCGPDLRGYTTDMARVWPVNGRFDPELRARYGLIQDYFTEMINRTRAGKRPREIYAEVDECLLARCDDPSYPHRSMKPVLQGMIEKGVHYFNHAVGMDVHDRVTSFREEPLQEGMVVVVDPMVWLPEEMQYIRTEDTIVVGKDGVEVLTALAPYRMEEIEALMAQPSAFDVLP